MQEFTYNSKNVQETEYATIPSGMRDVKVSEITENNIIFTDIATDQKIYQKIFDEDTIKNMLFTFNVKTEEEAIGTQMNVEVQNREHNGNTYSSVKLKFAPIPAGEYNCRVDAVESKVSGAGNKMIVVSLKLNAGRKTNYYIVQNEKFDTKLSKFFRSFNITPPLDGEDINFASWLGKESRAVITEGKDGDTGVYYFKPLVSQDTPSSVEVDDEIPF